MTEDEKFSLFCARHNWVITDPYPEYSRWEQEQHMRSQLDRFFRTKELNKKPDISIHKAWMDGFNFAWELIEKKVRQM